MPRGDPRESLNLLVSPEVKRRVTEFAQVAGISTNAAASVFLADAAQARAARLMAACTDQDVEDVAAIAMYAKTHADGPIREAACRILARQAG